MAIFHTLEENKWSNSRFITNILFLPIQQLRWNITITQLSKVLSYLDVMLKVNILQMFMFLTKRLYSMPKLWYTCNIKRNTENYGKFKQYLKKQQILQGLSLMKSKMHRHKMTIQVLSAILLTQLDISHVEQIVLINVTTGIFLHQNMCQ